MVISLPELPGDVEKEPEPTGSGTFLLFAVFLYSKRKIQEGDFSWVEPLTARGSVSEKFFACTSSDLPRCAKPLQLARQSSEAGRTTSGFGRVLVPAARPKPR